jgi:hypothetical protein
MAEAAQDVRGGPGTAIHVVADAGHSNGDKQKLAKNEGSFLMCRRFVESRIGETARCLSAAIFNITELATRFCVLRVNVCVVISGKSVAPSMRASGKCAERVHCDRAAGPALLTEKHRYDQALETAAAADHGGNHAAAKIAG